MRTKIVLFFLLFVCKIAYAQINLTAEQKVLSEKISQEKIYVHYNSNFLVTGESLYYKIYCLNIDTNAFSELSKIAYLEIIDAEKKTVLKQKIQLNNGNGSGDIFIDNTFKTGNYKIISYTEWMKNKNLFYAENISIYNAFTKPTKNTTVDSNISNSKNTKQITYKKREKVTLPINLKKGNYSISIKKNAPNLIPQKTSSKKFNTTFKNNKHQSPTFHIPEFRGEVLLGKVSSNSTKNVANLKVSFSIHEKNGNSKIASTNKDGTFYFIRKETLENNKLFIQVLTDSVAKYNIELLKKTSPDYKDENFSELLSTIKIRNEVKERSTFSQIENAFSTLKKDIIFKPSLEETIFQKNATTYQLNDYKRFNSMEETFVEVIGNAWASKNNGSVTFHVRDENLDNNNTYKSLVIIDGYLVNNHNLLADFHPKLIKTIHVFRKKYLLNSVTYQGVFYLETFNNSFIPSLNNSQLKVEGLNYTPKKTYYKQQYLTNSNTRIPDYRTQLLWNPTIDTSKTEITFYTSDVTGIFEINIEGFTNEGKPVSLKQYFKVE
ncbi:hypothetical protein [Mesoflavibacter zeaxanthinifaciens]|uniref:hypothetical protein n=1 Tax=Mesoflavibacter zeaxanthinifaciens TaxID=393060 RepID=UPI003A90482F